MISQELEIKNQIDVSTDFAGAYDALEKRHWNVFISGKAGTGKSTFLRYFQEHSDKNIVVVAPTGVAALNVGGQTIHSFFRFKPGLMDLDRIGIRRQRKLYEAIDVLVIDEISMVRADLFEAIEKFLRLNGPQRGQPFGGVQICVIGDVMQLPPVVSGQEEEIFYQLYETPFFFSTPSFYKTNFHHIEFDRIYRQSNQEFVHHLNEIRTGHVEQKTLDYFNQQVIGKEGSGLDNPIVLTTTNHRANHINQHYLDQLPGDAHTFSGKVSGKFGVSGDKLPVPETLQLKVGAQVMLTKNDPDKRWVNGSIGVVKSLSKSSIQVILNSNEGGDVVTVKRDKWETIHYKVDSVDGSINQEVVGTFTQYPLIHAWAITIHKSQGKTLDNVIIDLGSGVFAPGQLYVGLSRCRSLEGLALRRPITSRDIQSDNRVTDFIAENKTKKIITF